MVWQYLLGGGWPPSTAATSLSVALDVGGVGVCGVFVGGVAAADSAGVSGSQP